MQESLQNKTAQLPLAVREESQQEFGTTTNEAIIGGCDAAQIGAIHYALLQAKKLNHPVERIWLDGGNAKVLLAQIKKSDLQNWPIEQTEGLVLRGVWAWLLQNL
jgi:type III pantothenate kinase